MARHGESSSGLPFRGLFIFIFSLSLSLCLTFAEPVINGTELSILVYLGLSR